MQNILDSLVDSRIHNLLKIININYPNKFKKLEIEKELLYIKKYIFWKTKNNKIIIQKAKKANKIKKVIEFKKVKEVEIKEKLKKKLKDINQCSGRIWANYILNNKNMKQINDVEEKFKIEDFIDLDIKDFNSKYTIGKRCSKIKMQNGKYCKLHNKHLIHGDYLEIPNKELCYHFMKDGKYL